MFKKFQIDRTSTSSKTTSTKNLNLKRDRRTTRKHNAHKLGIKKRNIVSLMVFTRLHNAMYMTFTTSYHSTLSQFL